MKQLVRCALAALLASGCDVPADEFRCDTSAMCKLGALQGTCEIDHHCSLPDDTCSYAKRWVPHSAAASEQCFGSQSLSVAGTVMLGSTWFGQETPWFDAPAAARIAISTRRDNPASQQTLANEMNTNMMGTLGTNPVSTALSNYMAASYGTQVIDPIATAAQRSRLHADVTRNLSAGFPIVCTVESGYRPPGYPAGKIIHYVTVVGFRNGGDEVLIADPGASGKRGAGWEGVARLYWIATDDLATWIAGWGYATT